MRLVLATSNLHKLKEIQALLPETIQLISLADIHFNSDIEETEFTLEGNALLKARHIWQYCQTNGITFMDGIIADDSGLEVEALHGAPGVFSARYAGEPKSDEANNQKLLKELHINPNRKAQFRTVLAFVSATQTFWVNGIINGRIAHHPAGQNGFGYDPLFIPEGKTETFAQLSATEKNAISHRALAVNALLEQLLHITT